MTPYRRLLIACDGSEGSDIAAVHAAILAKKLGAEIHAVWVRGRLPHYPETIDEIDEEEESSHEFFDKIKERMGQIAQERTVSIRVEMRTGHPAQRIVESARELKSDLIVMGNRGHSRVWGGFLGHTADRVTDHAPCSVLIVRSPAGSAQFRKMLIGYDGSPGSGLALGVSLQLAKQLGSETHVMWILESHARAGHKTIEDSQEKLAEKHFQNDLLPRINAAAQQAGVSVQARFLIGNAAQSLILEAENRRFRIIALGHRGSSGIWGGFLGGVADRVSNLAHCDVLIVRERE